ncbi:MAG: hypothetical protein H0T76_20210 [Nannocystis sp.]|nr:low affinity iron permease family protein [Nannocystis sp.]MBA3548813.1 hypothetical protein [Nannocystis sp.]
MYAKIADRIEQACGHPFALGVFTLAFFIGLRFVSVDGTNIAVSYITAALLFMTIGGSRRDRKAVHAKLDEQLAKDEATDTAMAHLEDLSEAEIDKRRGQTC